MELLLKTASGPASRRHDALSSPAPREFGDRRSVEIDALAIWTAPSPFSWHSQASQPPDWRVDPPPLSHVWFQFMSRSDPLGAWIDRKILASPRRVLSLDPGDDAARLRLVSKGGRRPNEIWDFLTWSKSPWCGRGRSIGVLESSDGCMASQKEPTFNQATTACCGTFGSLSLFPKAAAARSEQPAAE